MGITGIQPPPTFVNPIIFDQSTNEQQFSPAWLDWFLRLADTLGSVTDTLGMNGVGQPGQFGINGQKGKDAAKGNAVLSTVQTLSVVAGAVSSQNLIASGGSPAWDLSQGGIGVLSLTANATITSVNQVSGNAVLIVTQTGHDSSPYTLTFDSTFAFTPDTPFIVTSGLNAIDTIKFTSDGAILHSSDQNLVGLNNMQTLSTNAWNATLGHLAVWAGGGTNIPLPTNLVPGTYMLIIPAYGGETLTYDPGYYFPGGTPFQPDPTTSGTDIITFVSNGASMFGVGQTNFS
jgi:hypothetical protein